MAAGLDGIKEEVDEFAKATPAEGVDIAELWAFIVDQKVTLQDILSSSPLKFLSSSTLEMNQTS